MRQLLAPDPCQQWPGKFSSPHVITRPGQSKAVFDYALAVALLPLAVILVAIAALGVKLTSSGPAFYTQTRLGLHGRRYRIIKIRTMHHQCEARSGVRWASRNDARVTRIGRILRATHVDEVPQLLNVLRGEMSLIGPRPERPEVVAAMGLTFTVRNYDGRLRVKPGVTGLAQVQLPADSDLRSVRRKVAYDLYYVRNRGLWLDLRILAATALKVVGAGPRLTRWVLGLPDRRDIARSHRSALTGGVVRDGGSRHPSPRGPSPEPVAIVPGCPTTRHHSLVSSGMERV